MSNQHAAFIGSIPEIYDAHLGPYLFEFSARDLADRIKDNMAMDGKILEVACGTGISTYHLRQVMSPDILIVATDLNPAMLDYARKKHAGLPGVMFEIADASSLTFDDHFFDAVVCQFGIMFFPDKAKGLAEMARTLKPGGILAFNVWESMEKNKPAAIAHETISSFFDDNPPQFLHTPFGFYDVEHIRNLLNEAGFEHIDVHPVTGKQVVHDVEHLAKGFIEGNPGVLEIRERASANTETVIHATVGALERAYGTAPFEIEFHEIVFMASKPAKKI